MNHWARNPFEKILQVTIRLSAGFWCLLGVLFVGGVCWGCLLGVLGCLLGVFTDCPHCSTNPRPHFLPFTPYWRLAPVLYSPSAGHKLLRKQK